MFESILRGASPAVRALTVRAREIIREQDPTVVEVVWERQRIAGYGVGPRKMSEHYAYLAPQSAHLNLGFYRGSELPDPTRMLEGSGKLLRHVKIPTLEALESDAIRDLLRAAREERAQALDRG